MVNALNMWFNLTSNHFSSKNGPSRNNPQVPTTSAPLVPSPSKNLEDMLQTLMQTHISFTNQTTQAITELRTSSTQNTHAINELRNSVNNLTKLVTTQEKGNFPAQPWPNPRGEYKVNVPTSFDSQFDQVKVVTTLRCGKVIAKDLLNWPMSQ